MKILILNVHSAHNLGDHGIMLATLQTLQAQFPDVCITIAANDPESWRAPDRLANLNRISVAGSLITWVARLQDGRWQFAPLRMILYLVLLSLAALTHRLLGWQTTWGTEEQRRLLAAYYEADLVLSCGGGNFYAYRRLSPFLLWNLCALIFAVVLGKPLLILPQSIGPIPGSMQRGLMRWVLRYATTIAVREPWSYRFVTHDLRVQAPVHLLPDLAFGLARADLPKRSVTRRVQIGVTVLDRSAQLRGFVGQSNYEDTLCALLAQLAQQRDVEISLFSQCYGPSIDQDDRLAAQRLSQRLSAMGVNSTLWPALKTAQEALDAYANMDAMIGTRMHTAIFAICNATPVLLISYQPKGCNVMALCGLERYCCDIEQLDTADLYQRACELLDRQAELRAYLAAQRTKLKAQADSWIQFVSV